jgi:3-oxoacyl-[acyl-carrier protein] reductase
VGKLAGKVAVVTGASKGIGAEIAWALAAEGAAVTVNYASDEAGATRVVARIEAAGGRAVAVRGNVACAADLDRLFEESHAAFGLADILVNNAGVFRFGPLASATEAEFHRQIDVNVLGVILATQRAVAQFGDRGGSIINISSTVSQRTPPNAVIYAATKGAVDAMTRVLAKELAPRRIRVNAISPGGVETEGAQSNGVLGGEFERQMVAATPLGRIGRPDDIAPVAVFLASDDAKWITGEILLASGGLR